MNKVSLPLCLFGAALATANILIMQRPTCSSAGAEIAAPDKTTSSTPEAVSPARGTSARAPKAASPQAERPQAPKAAVTTAKPPAPKAAAKPPGAPQDVQVTGSVGQTPQTQEPKGEKPASVPQAQLAQLAEVSAGPGKVEDKPEEWAEVSLAAKVHNAPSVSAPTVRYYRVGTGLRVIGREPGWIKVVDPTTFKEGWIFHKYLTLKEGPDQKRTPQSNMSDDVSVSAPAQPGPYARPYRLRKYDWRWPPRRPPIGFAFGVYPRW